MEKQIKLYSINLGLAKNEEEKELADKRNRFLRMAYKRKKYYARKIREELKLKTKEWNDVAKEMFKNLVDKDSRLVLCDKEADKIKKQLHELYSKNIKVRSIKTIDFKKKNNIAFFENDLTRMLQLMPSATTLDFIVIEAKKQDDVLLEQVLKLGVTIDEEEYIFFTAGAGQTRKQKFLMIKKEVWAKYEKILLCGLTIDKINEMGSLNIQKFLAYLSLNMTASYIKEDFDIDRCIVVDDFETMVNGEVDYITRNDNVENGYTEYTIKNGVNAGKQQKRKKTKVEWNVERTVMDVPIPHMDGCGLCLPKFSNKKNIQIRMPWMKGLLTPVSFINWCKTERIVEDESERYKVVDLWKKEWDLIKDDIQVIFTKSQFKLWKFYTDWEDYKNNFKQYNRTLSICKEDPKEYKDMCINYQMLQTLTDMTDEQIETMLKRTKQLINDVHHDRDAQLRFLGASIKDKNEDDSSDRTYFQEILRNYPEMLMSAYVKKQISDGITSIKKDAKSGRIKLNAKRTFIIPDIVAFMNWLFNKEETPKGVLDKDEVYCKLYKNDDRVCALRSPHLSREWAVRKNRANIENIEWFITDGIYTSSHDLISKMLTFDVDGDEALVISNKEKWLLDLAEQQMEDIRPLYYEMGKAGAKEINIDNIFESLKFVYHKGNIGKISNCITNIWSDGYKGNMDNIKLLTAYNNFVIDSAKTLEIPKLPKELKELTKNKKYPYFFQWAKGKNERECMPIGNGVIDRICKCVDDIPYQEFKYNRGFGNFRVAKLMNNPKVEIDYKIIEYYLGIEEQCRIELGNLKQRADEDDDFNKMGLKEEIYDEAKQLILMMLPTWGITLEDFVDMVIKYSFKEDSLKMAFMFECFGDIILQNLNENIKKPIDNGYILCEECGKRILKTNNRMKRCEKCSKQVKKQNDRNRNSIKKNPLKAS